MTWSAPMCLTKAHLTAPPADPMTVCPLSLAIWHTTDPTAPEAAETNTTSPGLGIAILRQPNQEETRSPGLNRGSSEAATSPIAPPCSVSPTWKFGRQPYMVELDAAISPIAPGTSLPGRDDGV